ncbi:Pre-mRNA-splicing factor ATP-dependent RNA helicase prp22 [Cyphellophora attinorum]|uniref:RNA helicase n=1 Tax=Cyphellophora attinorum TaxID=1664694 RepID=A0A0N1HHV4_9EURO|nr:Pre-mRNA-splicing factor ATP-dependent RNA helicase prp22 [Phialophora attinorum]KPI35485.1 Pre-mRNA-splicing factor ATP-dependent RNA helicase prp22 [Phialophora attinorum]
MDDLASLELLSLVSRVTSEIKNHLGVEDKTLAEFFLDQHEQCAGGTLPEFKKVMHALDDSLPESLVESIHRSIHTMHPKYKKQHAAKDSLDEFSALASKAKMFTGLAVPDRQQQWDELEDDTPGQKTIEVAPTEPALDDTFAMLAGLAPSANGHSRKRSRSPERENGSFERRSKQRYSRSPSPRREKHSRRRRDSDEYDDRRSRHRHRDRDHRSSRKEENLDEHPVLFKIYDGVVKNVKDFGAFVNLRGVKGSVDGLVHVSAIQDGARVNHPSDLLSRDQVVKVKVNKLEDGKISLSMKEVDQITGEDLAPSKRIASGANMERMSGMDRFGNMAQEVPVIEEDLRHGRNGRPNRKRMTTPERWEIKQLIASGAAKAEDYPEAFQEYNDNLNGDGNPDELEEDVDIEVRDDEPPFLAGQTKQSLELSPIRVVKAPEGSLNRAAQSGTNLAKERREMRQQEATDKAAEEASKVNLNEQWQDPMINPEDRKFASELRQTQQQTTKAIGAVPEWKRATQGQNVSLGRRTDMTIKQQRESLPVFKFRKQILDAVAQNQLLIVVGDTGSGKTTQLTQYLAEGGYANDGMIACTQPRRVAAMSVAKRVSEEVGCELGREVGYTIRFEDRTSPETRIKYMTDGMLQREILMDPDLKRYTVIMLDEAHERTIATDVLFGLLKKTIKRRPDLKLIVTSATLDADKFSDYFNQCPIFSIPGRTYPVEIMYSREPEEDYLDAALTTVMQIHLTEPAGDILVFLTGQEEIDTSCEVLYERMKALGPSVPELIVLPVYSALPSEMQSRIFDPAPPGSRKVVIATNIAETSITIDHIYYVIDPGFVKQNAYDPKLGMDSLIVTPISQAQAKQRAGRAGRTGPGKCFRLYTEAAYQSEMLATTIPEIQRQNLSNTILMLKAMGINDLLHFDFMDPPPTNTMLTALEELYALSALDDEGLLTRLGRKMADFPMEPALAKVLIASVDSGCSEEMLSIVAMLSVQSVFYRPKEKQTQADQKKAKFHDSHGDHLTLLNVYNGWKNSRFSDPWCFENFIQKRQIMRARDVRQQLLQIFTRYKHPVISCGRNTLKVRQALCSGFFRNSARKDPQEGYKTLIEGTPVYMHPSSALFGKPAEHVIYHTLVLTTKEYMHCATVIEPRWLVEAAPTFFKEADKGKLSKRKKAERIQPLHDKFRGEDEWRLSAQRRQGGRGGGGTWG